MSIILCIWEKIPYHKNITLDLSAKTNNSSNGMDPTSLHAQDDDPVYRLVVMDKLTPTQIVNKWLYIHSIRAQRINQLFTSLL